jgi:hypothetical protein
MNNKIKTLIYFLFSLFLLIYGVAAGHYGLFPYSQLLELRDSRLFEQIKTLTLRLSGAGSVKPVRTVDTSLQRLLVKEIPIKTDQELSANYLSTTGNYLYILSTHGEFRIYNLTEIQAEESNPEPVPMNLDVLKNSDIIQMQDFSLHHFRVLDLHTEESPNGNHSIFVTHYSYDETKECISFDLSRTTYSPYSGETIEEWKTIFNGLPCLYPESTDEGTQRFRIRLTSGGNMISFDEDHLLVSAGDHGFDGVIKESLINKPEIMPGKMILIHKDTGDYSYYAEGIRNSQGMFKDRSGVIWATGHGPQGGDELNIIREGMHYGWPEVSYGIEYDNKPLHHSDQQGIHEGYEKPVYVWMNTIAPAEIIRLEENPKFTLWNGDLIVVALRDQSLHRLRLNDNNRIMYSERIPMGHRLRDITILPDGSLALMTDEMILIIIEDGGPVFEESGEKIDGKIKALERYNRFVE